MVIQIDTREKARAIVKIVQAFDNAGVKHFSSKLPVGDYMNLDNPKLVIDRKQNLAELCNNTSSVPKKDADGRVKRRKDGKADCELYRFTDELQRANEYGIKLIILCEHGSSIKCLEDVQSWVNPRLKESPLAVSGQRLYKILLTLSKTYGVEFRFCDKRQTGKKILEILEAVPDEL